MYNIGPSNLLRGYADDTAAVVQNLWSALPALNMIFSLICVCSRLSLNARKCVIIPLWHYRRSSVKQLLTEFAPAWRDFCISSYGKYLGFFIGPGAGCILWQGISKSYLEACRHIASLKLLFFARRLAYRSFALSKLVFPSQIYRLPSFFMDTERKGVNLIFKGPGNTAPTVFFHFLKESGVFPVSLSSARTLAFSSRARVALNMHSLWKPCSVSFERARQSNNADLKVKFPDWFCNSSVHALECAWNSSMANGECQELVKEHFKTIHDRNARMQQQS